MARYTGADCKLCRREKVKLFLKGSKCDSPKCPIEIRPYPPGEHGRKRPKEGDYLQQIREKQKARRIYGVLEKQFAGYYVEAARKSGRTGETLLQILESRLDNVVFRAGFAKSRDMARQLVGHGHLLVNGRRVNIPSYRVRENDVVEVAAKSLELTPMVVARAEVGDQPDVLREHRRLITVAPGAIAQSDPVDDRFDVADGHRAGHDRGLLEVLERLTRDKLRDDLPGRVVGGHAARRAAVGG